MLLQDFYCLLLRKNLYGRIHELPNLKDHVEKCVDKGIYDRDILTFLY